MAISDLSHVGGHQMSFEVQHLMGRERDAFRLKGTGLELSIQENPPAKMAGSSWLPCVIGATELRSQAGPRQCPCLEKACLAHPGAWPLLLCLHPKQKGVFKNGGSLPSSPLPTHLGICPLTFWARLAPPSK